MSITELQILLNLSYDNELVVLDRYASLTDYGYLFVDSEDGHCYLFNKNGKMDDIKKMKIIANVKKDIKKIAIPESVKSIGYNAFRNCTSLTSINIPDSVESIGSCAFYNCTSLTSIKIPESVKSIGEWVFWNCTSLTSIEIPKSVESIGDWAFIGCASLKSIKIPENVESIEYEAFACCISLKEVIFKGKMMNQVKEMDEYSWGIEDESIIKCG